jgi:hypothetical protein
MACLAVLAAVALASLGLAGYATYKLSAALALLQKDYQDLKAAVLSTLGSFLAK